MSSWVDHSAWRIDLARAYIAPYAERAPIAVLGGSVAQGVADRWSDIDTIVYWDEIDRDWLETPRAAADGERFTWLEHYPGNACLEQYRFGTVKADIAHVRLGWLDELIDGVLSGENTDTTSLDVLRGVAGVDRPLRRGALRADPRTRARLPRRAPPLDGRGDT